MPNTRFGMNSPNIVLEVSHGAMLKGPENNETPGKGRTSALGSLKFTKSKTNTPAAQPVEAQEADTMADTRLGKRPRIEAELSSTDEAGTIATTDNQMESLSNYTLSHPS